MYPSVGMLLSNRCKFTSMLFVAHSSDLRTYGHLFQDLRYFVISCPFFETNKGKTKVNVSRVRQMTKMYFMKICFIFNSFGLLKLYSCNIFSLQKNQNGIVSYLYSPCIPLNSLASQIIPERLFLEFENFFQSVKIFQNLVFKKTTNTNTEG